MPLGPEFDPEEVYRDLAQTFPTSNAPATIESFAQRPEAPAQLGTQGATSPEEMARAFEDMARELQFGMREPQIQVGPDPDLSELRWLAMTRLGEISAPTPSKPMGPPMTTGQETQARILEKARLDGALRKISEVERDRMALKLFQEKHPDLAERINLNDSWFEKLQRAAMGAGRKGWRALDILLRNLDRGRGAITAHQLALEKGATAEDAKRAAMAALRGSDKGWVFIPEEMGPTWKEVLLASGYDDNISTAGLGLGLDLLVDPINILGIGASRKGITLGAHQILNTTGRAKYGELVQLMKQEAMAAAGAASELDLSVDAIRNYHRAAGDEMRKLLSVRGNAEQFLDMGGLKIAGYTLPGTSFLRKKEVLRKGVLMQDYVAESLAKIVGRGTLDVVDRLGARLSTKPGNLQRDLGRFMQWVPQQIRDTGNAMGFLFHRTNPQAGLEYKWFKQAEYYDKLGFETLMVRDTIARIFHGIDASDLEELSMVLEEGTLDVFLQQLAARKGGGYAARVAEASQMYRAAMDDLLIEEVHRGFLPRKSGKGKKAKGGFNPQTRQRFEDWVRTGSTVGVSEKLLKRFSDIRVKNYVSHIYESTRRVRAFRPRELKPRAPSITEPFTHARVVPTLREAQRLGFVPKLNLAEIAAIRMQAGRRALTTHDFLSESVERFGRNISPHTPAAQKMIFRAGTPLPEPTWKEVMNARTNHLGRIAMPVEEQLNKARQMAFESLVPIEAVAKLDDAARREFLLYRFRHAPNNRSADFIWKKYVEEAEAAGRYKGRDLAPGRDANESIVNARDIYDPNYQAWTPMQAGGLADPAVLGKVWLPVPIAEDLARVSASYLPDELRQLFSLYDRINFWWKRAMTIVWPAFHTRNKLTNVVNSAMEIGVGGILDRGTMWSIMQGGDGVLHTPHGPMSYSQVRKLSRRLGIINVTYRRPDVGDLLGDIVERESKARSKLARRMGWKLPGRERFLPGGKAAGEAVGPAQIGMPVLAPFQAGTEMGLWIENADRMQLFVQSLKRGLPPDEAAQRVFKFLFDYQDLGWVESELIRRFFFPFWTWTRKNLQLQAGLIANRPGRFVSPFKFARSLSAEKESDMRSDVERTLLPQYLNDLLAVRLPDGVVPLPEGYAERLSTWIMNFDLPGEDVNRLWQGSWRETLMGWFAQVGPFQRDILEELIGKDFFSGAERTQFIRGSKVYPIIKAMPQKMQDWLEVSYDTYRDQEIIRVNRKKWRTLNWMFAWNLTRLYSTIGKIDDPSAGPVSHRIFNALTGMRFEYIDPAQQMLDEVDAILSDEDVGMKANLDMMWRRAMKQLQLKKLNARAAEDEMQQIREAVDVIEHPSALDLEPEGTWTYENIP